jgi:hypothetical protein
MDPPRLTHVRVNVRDLVKAIEVVAGLLLTTGNQAQQLGDRLAVAPVDALWRG